MAKKDDKDQKNKSDEASKDEANKSDEQLDLDEESKPVPVFSVEVLRHKCMELFGIPVYIYDGVTCGLTDGFTIEEMKQKIDDWRKKPVTQNRKEGK